MTLTPIRLHCLNNNNLNCKLLLSVVFYESYLIDINVLKLKTSSKNKFNYKSITIDVQRINPNISVCDIHNNIILL